MTPKQNSLYEFLIFFIYLYEFLYIKNWGVVSILKSVSNLETEPLLKMKLARINKYLWQWLTLRCLGCVCGWWPGTHPSITSVCRMCHWGRKLMKEGITSWTDWLPGPSNAGTARSQARTRGGQAAYLCESGQVYVHRGQGDCQDLKSKFPSKGQLLPSPRPNGNVGP